ncbi:MAG: LTA synthase family protein [Oscillospiraceae bacterium]|nr:LTA synthase family protein [Oscillospiraceae bacterium]
MKTAAEKTSSRIHFLLPPLLALLCRSVAGSAPLDAFVWLSHSPGAFLLDVFLFAAGYFLVLALCGKAWAAWLAGIFPLAANLVSHFKLAINGAPLMLSDLSLAGQFGEIAGFALPQLRPSVWVLLSVLLFFAVLVLLILYANRLPASRSLRRAGGAGGALALLLLLVLPFREPFYAPLASADAETTLRLCASWRKERLSVEADAETLERIRRDVQASPASPAAPSDCPTVIFLMSESFFDLSRLPGVRFAQDPIPHFHELCRSFPHGRFYTNTYAGGTGFVEMEVLTGLCSAFLKESDNLTALPDEVYPTLPCITDALDAAGYREYFVHSYNDALYNRRWIYHALGFEETIFDADFPADAERKGDGLSDMALSEELIRLYEAKGGSPLMMYAISMENHQPYTPGKYGAENDIALESDMLDETALETLRTYAYTARDADRALERLTDYFSTAEGKVMIVFWGDHMPSFSVGASTIYEQLGYVETSDSGKWSTDELGRMLSTDYVIWTNYEPARPVEAGAESCNMLGFHVLRDLGMPLSDYYLWLEKRIDPFFLLYRSRLFCAADAQCFADYPSEYGEQMEEFRAAVRDAAYGGGSVFTHYREEAKD